MYIVNCKLHMSIVNCIFFHCSKRVTTLHFLNKCFWSVVSERRSGSPQYGEPRLPLGGHMAIFRWGTTKGQAELKSRGIPYHSLQWGTPQENDIPKSTSLRQQAMHKPVVHQTLKTWALPIIVKGSTPSPKSGIKSSYGTWCRTT